MKKKGMSCSYCNNHHRQPNKRFCNFCKCLYHSIETCYHHNKSSVFVSTATVTKTKNIQPMALICTKSTSSRSTFTISIVDLQNVITNTIRMVGMPPSSWLMDFSCHNHMTPHSFLFSQLELAPHPFNICTANGSTMFGHNIGYISTSNLLVLEVFNVPNFSYNLFSMGKLAELGYHITFYYSGCIVQDPRIGQDLGIGPRVGLYIFHGQPSSSTYCSCFCCCCSFFCTFSCILACPT